MIMNIIKIDLNGFFGFNLRLSNASILWKSGESSKPILMRYGKCKFAAIANGNPHSLSENKRKRKMQRIKLWFGKLQIDVILLYRNLCHCMQIIILLLNRRTTKLCISPSRGRSHGAMSSVFIISFFFSFFCIEPKPNTHVLIVFIHPWWLMCDLGKIFLMAMMNTSAPALDLFPICIAYSTGLKWWNAFDYSLSVTFEWVSGSKRTRT